MAVLTLGAGARYAIAPFKLRELRLAAPFIDRLAARAGQPATVEAVAEAAADMVAVLAVGVADATPESLLAQIALDDLDGLRATFEAVLAEAGLKRPDVGAAAATASEGAAPGEAAPPPNADP